MISQNKIKKITQATDLLFCYVHLSFSFLVFFVCVVAVRAFISLPGSVTSSRLLEYKLPKCLRRRQRKRDGHGGLLDAVKAGASWVAPLSTVWLNMRARLSHTKIILYDDSKCMCMCVCVHVAFLQLLAPWVCRLCVCETPHTNYISAN